MSRAPTANEPFTFALSSSSARKRSQASVRSTGFSDWGSTGITPPAGLATSTVMPVSRKA